MKSKGNLFKKIFIFVSATFLLTLILVYSYRLVHFYLLENGTSNEEPIKKYFADKLKTTINVSNISGGLYIIEDEYLYKFNATKNYLWYSGQLWRILKINEDKTIDIVMDDALTILNASYGDTYYIENYLEEFYQKLDKDLLVEVDYCNDRFENVENVVCNVKKQDKITLLDIYTYSKAGGNSSFLNNSTSFWLSNKNTSGDNWYIQSDGSLAVGKDTNSFGIRPVVRLKSEVSLVSGDGTEKNPYIIKENNKPVVGEYVKFNDSIWRILAIDEEGIVISSEECLSLDGKCILKSFGNTNVFENSELYKYLNETYYNSIYDKDLIVKNRFGIGDYINHNYNNTTLKEVEAYVGIAKVSDYYISKKTNSYLLTTNDLQAIYSINDTSNYYLDFTSKEKEIYPVLKLDRTLTVQSGDGTKNNPYILSR